MKKWFIGIVVLALVGGGVWYWRSGGGEQGVRILETVEVERGSVRKVLEATGIVKSQVGAAIQVGAQATGVLDSVPVRVGDRVEQGQLIAVIDDREVQARLAEARARVRLAQAKFDYAQKNLPRRKRLVKQDLEAVDTLDQAVQNTRVARHEVAAARAAVNTLEIQLSYYKIFSPITGVVSQVAAQEGETVVSGLQVSNLITVVDPDSLEMWIYVDETDVGRTEVGQKVEFRVDAHPDKVFYGRVDTIYPEPEVRDNIVYYRALVRLDRSESKWLRPEMTTQCRIIVEVREDVLSIPNEALKWVDGKQTVFVQQPGGKARETYPELGLAGLERTEVLSGLQGGDKVAVQLVLPKAGQSGER